MPLLEATLQICLRTGKLCALKKTYYRKILPSFYIVFPLLIETCYTDALPMSDFGLKFLSAHILCI
jgi:hypothetical protein